MQNGRADEAEAALHLLPNKASMSSENAYYAGRIFSQRKKPDVAIQAFEDALSIDRGALVELHDEMKSALYSDAYKVDLGRTGEPEAKSILRAEVERGAVVIRLAAALGLGED